MSKIIESYFLVPRYWAVIFKETVRESGKVIPAFKGGIVNWFLNSRIQLFILLLVAIGIPNLNFVKNIVEGFSTKPFEFIIYAALIIFTDFLFNFIIYVPAKLYFDTKKEADKFTWNDIRVSEYRFPKETGDRIGLEITNEKTITIQTFHVLIASIKLDSRNIPIKGITHRFFIVKGKLLDDRRENATFHPTSPTNPARIIEIAIVRGNKAWFVTSADEEEWTPIRPNADYYFFITPQGEISSNEGKCIFKPQTWEGKVRFENGNLNIKMKPKKGW